jgi:predicted glycosyltransferase
MYVGFYLGAGKSQFIGLESTLLGVPDVADEKKPGEPAALTSLRDKLDAATKSRRDWKTFAKAIQTGTEDLLKNKEKIAAADPLYQWIDLAEARAEGIMPIPFAAAK